MELNGITMPLQKSVWKTLGRSRRDNTKKTYDYAIRSYHTTYKKKNYANLICHLQYLLDNGKTLSTIRLHYYAISGYFIHNNIMMNEKERYVLKEFLKGVKNTLGAMQVSKDPILRKNPFGLTISDIDDYIDKSRIRNKEEIRFATHLCFTGGFRMNEVLKLTSSDIIVKGSQIKRRRQGIE